MTNSAIKVENVSKKYQLGSIGSTSLREALSSSFRSLFFRSKSERQEFVAVNDVSFDIGEGEVVGLIGRNGAGKSTLLKILSRITEPTAGRITTRGRISSLLEVGTGFHPELTGRENIFLNRSILGMHRAEIRRKFDEIVSFSGVEAFLDTPVKRYSSGMFVRLAFSVAAHLEPEILVIDEVLSVGDAEFQRKCLGKMNDVAGHGRTILFVSHNMAAVSNLCSRCIYLQSGSVTDDGAPAEIIAKYLSSNIAESEGDGIFALESTPRSRGKQFAIKRGWFENADGEITRNVLLGDSLKICFEYECEQDLVNPGFGFGVETIQGQRVFSLNNYMSGVPEREQVCSGVAELLVPEVLLTPDKYFVSLSVVQNQVEWIDYVEQALSFEVEASDIYGTGKIMEKGHGLMHVRGRVETREK